VLWIVTLLSLAVLALVWLFIPETDVRSRARLDYAGAVLLGATLACLVIALGKGNEWGWSAGSTLGLLAAGAVLAALWTGWQLRAASPMVDLRIVRRRSVWPAFLLCAFATMLGSTNTMIVSQFLKTPGVAGYGFGLAVMAAGLCLMPVGLLIMTGGIVMPRVIAAIGIRRSGVIGAVVLIAAFTWGIVARTHIWQLIVEMVLYGIGHAMCFTSGKSAYLRGARPGEQGMITGAQNSLALALMGAGPTIVTAIVTSSYIKGTPFPRETNFEYTWLFFIGVAVCMLGLSLYLKVTDTDQNLAPDAVIVRT
jgi:hypothetical protein